MSDGPVIIAFGQIKRLSPGTVIFDPVVSGNLTVEGVVQTDGITINPLAANPQTDPALAPDTLWNNNGTLMLGADPVVPTALLQEYTATAVWSPLQFVDNQAIGPDPLPMTSTLTEAERTINFSRIGSQVTMQFASALLFGSGAAGAGGQYLYADMDLIIPPGFEPDDGTEDISFGASRLENNNNVQIAPEIIFFNANGMRLQGTLVSTFLGDSTYTADPPTTVWAFSWLTSTPFPPSP